LHRLAVFGAGLLVTLSGLAIKTYYTAMQTADEVAEIHSDVKALLRNDAAQDQRERDTKERVDRLENRGER
jgi:hypothetical protein